MPVPSLLLLPDGRLALQTEKGPEAIHITPCFPWTAPLQYLSLRNSEGEELYFLKNPDDLDASSQEILKAEMSRSTGTFLIESIPSLRKEIELRCWEVITTRGPRSFQTELDEWPRELPDGSFLVEDLFGDLYKVPALKNLDPASQKRFWPLVG